MNDLYIHQLETENKQLREVLKSTNEVVKEYLEKEKYCDELENKIDKTIDFIDNWEKYKKDKGSLEVTMLDLLYIKEILGDKENE